MTKGKLIVFDVEGVIIPKGLFHYKIIHRHRQRQLPSLLITGVKYLIGLTRIKSAITSIFNVLKDLPEDTINQVINEIPLKPGAQETIKILHQHGYKTALITSGIPKQALKSLRDRLDIDYIIGPNLTTRNGRLTGMVTGIVLEKKGKATALDKLKEEHNLHGIHTVAVADDRNNIPLFKHSDTTIGYNPDFHLTLHADHIVTGDLRKTLPIITGQTPESPTIQKTTILRKLVHASSILIPLTLLDHLGTYPIVALLILAMTLYTVSEAHRIHGNSLPFFTWFTLQNTTNPEASEFVDAPLFYALGITLTLLIYPTPTARAAIAVLAIGDSAASLTGILIGRHKLPYSRGKTIEGTIAGFTASLLAASIFQPPTRALIAALTGTLAEALPTPFNDNLVIPLAVGLALTIT
jgi:phytol kinase